MLQKEVNNSRLTILNFKKNILFALLFWVAGLGLLLLGIIYGFSVTLYSLLEIASPAGADLAITNFYYFVLLSIFFVIFNLTLEKAWLGFHNLAEFYSLVSTAPGLIAKETTKLFIFRFAKKTYFSISSLLSLTLFGIAPLVALGLVIGPPWYYYLFILPVLYIFLIIPVSFGVLASLLVQRLLPVKGIAQLAGGINFFLGFLWLAVFIFGIGAVLPPLLSRLEAAEPMLSFVFPLTVAAAVFEHLLEGEPVLALPYLGGLFFIGMAFFAGTVALTQRLYCAGYGKNQVKAVVGLPSSGSLFPLGMAFWAGPLRKIQFKLLSGKKSKLILADWKENFSDLNLIVGIGLFVLIGGLAYLFAAGRFFPQGAAWHNLVLLGHTGISGFLAYVILAIFKSAVLLKGQDTRNINIEILKERECRLYKAASLRSNEVVWCRWIVFYLPAMALSGLMLLLINITINSDISATLLSMAALALLLGSFLALEQWMELAIYNRGKGTLIQNASSYVYYVLGLGVLALGQIYQQIGFLGFIRHLPQETVTMISGAAFVLLTVFVLLYSLRLAARSWEEIEI